MLKHTYSTRLDHLVPFEKAPIPHWVQAINWQAVHMDANEGLIFARQLEYIESTVYQQKYPALKARELFDIDYTVPSGASTYSYYMYDKVGAFELISNYADDFSQVHVKGKKENANIEGFGAQVTYSIQDVRAASMAGVPLDAMQMMAARDAYEQRLDQVALTGDTAANIYGLLNHPNVPQAAVPNGAGGTPEWSTKTPDEILADLNAMTSETIDETNGVEMPDTIVLPHAQYGLISTTARSSTSDTTILEYFLRNSTTVRRVIPWYKLKGAGAGGTDLMFSYRKDPVALQLVIPQEFEQLPPQPKNMAFVTLLHARLGGLRIRYPLSVRIKRGI